MKNHHNKLRVYYYVLLGALGGTTGWFVTALAFRGADADPPTVAAKGVILGALIGLAIAAYDGVVSRSFRRFFKFGLIGLLLGALGGGGGLSLGQQVFSRLWSPTLSGGREVFSLSSFLVGTLCWMILGGLIGLVEVIGKGTQSYKGLLGGIFGALVGGGIYELARAYTQTSAGEPNPSQAIQAVSLGVMGGAIGGSVALISTLFRRAWLVVLDGKLKDHIYDLTKYVSKDSVIKGKGKENGGAIIGSDELRVTVYLPADKEVLPQHAVLRYANEAPMLLPTPEALKSKAKTLVNNYPVSTWYLTDKDKIQIGTTNLLYRQISDRDEA
jgi:hypothetical protein